VLVARLRCVTLIAGYRTSILNGLQLSSAPLTVQEERTNRSCITGPPARCISQSYRQSNTERPRTPLTNQTAMPTLSSQAGLPHWPCRMSSNGLTPFGSAPNAAKARHALFRLLGHNHDSLVSDARSMGRGTSPRAVTKISAPIACRRTNSANLVEKRSPPFPWATRLVSLRLRKSNPLGVTTHWPPGL